MEADQIFAVALKVGMGLIIMFGMYILKDLATSMRKATGSIEKVNESVHKLNVQIATLIEKDLAKTQRLEFQEKHISKLDNDNDYLRKGHIENSTKISQIQEAIYELKNQE